MENEKLIAALRYCDAVVNDTVNTGSCNFCPYRDHCSDLDNEAADALERLTAQNAEKDAEIEQLKNSNEVLRAERAERDRLQAELDACKDDMTEMASSSAPCCWCKKKKGWITCKECHFEWRGKENGDGTD